MAAATAAQAEDINAPFDADMPAWGWGWADESPDVFGDGWRILTGSWRVEGGQLRGNFPRDGLSNILVYGRQGAGPDYESSLEVTATANSNEVVFGGIVFSLKDQNTFLVIRVRILGDQSLLQVVKNSLVDGKPHEQALMAPNLLPAGAALEQGITYKISIKAAGEGEIGYTLTNIANGSVIAEGKVSDPEATNGGLIGVFSSAPYLLFGNFKAANLTAKGLFTEGEPSQKPGTNPTDQLVTWMKPIWTGNVSHDESVLFWAPEGQRPFVPLLYSPTKILSVRSATLKTTYDEGTDWKLDGNKIVLPEGSRIPWTTEAEMYPQEAGPPGTTMPKVGGGYMLFREGGFFHQKQLVVTYEHDGQGWDGPVPKFDESLLPKTIAKLRAKEPLKIVLFGDSISAGANASGSVGAPPFLPNWGDLTRAWLQYSYKGNILLANESLGGANSHWGAANAAKAFAPHRPDLVIIGFGMNDRTVVSPEDFARNIRAMMDAAKAVNPEVEFILVQSMEPNQEWSPLGNLNAYGDFLKSLQGPGVAVADVQSVHASLLKHKRYVDMTGNNVNHTNDFLTRVYAQVVSALLLPPSQKIL
jgi:hypothetical protein